MDQGGFTDSCSLVGTKLSIRGFKIPSRQLYWLCTSMFPSSLFQSTWAKLWDIRSYLPRDQMNLFCRGPSRVLGSARESSRCESWNTVSTMTGEWWQPGSGGSTEHDPILSGELVRRRSRTLPEGKNVDCSTICVKPSSKKMPQNSRSKGLM